MQQSTLGPPEWFFREWNRTALLPARYTGIVEAQAGTQRRHNLRHFRLRVVLEGTLTITRRDQRIKTTRNDIFIIPPSWHFMDQVPNSGNCRFLEIQMEAICSQGVSRHVFSQLNLPAVVTAPDPQRLVTVCKACAALVSTRMSPHDRLRMNPLLQELLVIYLLEGFRTGQLHEKFHVAGWLYELRNLLDEEWKNNALTLEVLAACFKRSPSTLQHGFKEAFGTTISEYRIRQRIAMACRILRLNPDLKAESIARQCGYRSLSLFYRQFKEQTGVTPMAYHPLKE